MTSTPNTKKSKVQIKENVSKIFLPKTAVKATKINPRTMILYGPPKVGKTSMFKDLEDYLLIDIEDGSDFADLVKIKANSMKELFSVAQAVKEENEAAGKKVYKYGVIDTVSQLEEWVDVHAWNKYKKTTMGAGMAVKYPDIKGIRELPNGAGYYHLRNELIAVLNGFANLFEHLIIIAHVKDKEIVDDMTGALSSTKQIALAGKLADILPSKFDSVGFVYRDEGKLKISFDSGNSVVAGLRGGNHLVGRVIDMETEGWNEIFIKEESE